MTNDNQKLQTARLADDEIKQCAAEIVKAYWPQNEGHLQVTSPPELRHCVERALREGAAMYEQDAELNREVWAFLAELLDPEGLGHAVTQEVRNDARALIAKRASL